MACVHTGAGKFLIVAFAVWFCGGGVELIATPLDQLAREHSQTLIDLGIPPENIKIVNTKNLLEVITFVRGVSVGSAPVYVIGHPEALLELVAAKDLKRNKSISVAVLDEAELAVDWASFRAAWSQCRRLREQNDSVRWVGCTGSSSSKGRIQIANNVGIHVEHILVGKMHRDDLEYLIVEEGALRPRRNNLWESGTVKDFLMKLIDQALEEDTRGAILWMQSKEGCDKLNDDIKYYQPTMLSENSSNQQVKIY